VINETLRHRDVCGNGGTALWILYRRLYMGVLGQS